MGALMCGFENTAGLQFIGPRAAVAGAILGATMTRNFDLAIFLNMRACGPSVL